jgi:hypothetical protein
MLTGIIPSDELQIDAGLSRAFTNVSIQAKDETSPTLANK